ncbi:MAG: sugar phosphate isomerase/epimerase, partial [Chloroflexales bacterium]|nr:sugar phosphate isomerase/epimerase [Chloroflexales bacterium]
MVPFKLALNASTLFPFALDATQQVRVAAEAGFTGLEVWMKDIEAYLAAGGTLRSLRGEARDSGIAIVNAITFFPWADADAAIQAAGLAQATREMALLAELGCVAVAAPPYGNVADTTLDAIAGAFARLHAAAQQTGIDVYLEFWGRAPRLSRLSEALYIAVESGVADAKLLLDPFHMYTGGSTLQSIGYLNGANIGIVHVNDYPAQPM